MVQSLAEAVAASLTPDVGSADCDADPGDPVDPRASAGVRQRMQLFQSAVQQGRAQHEI